MALILTNPVVMAAKRTKDVTLRRLPIDSSTVRSIARTTAYSTYDTVYCTVKLADALRARPCGSPAKVGVN